MCKLFTAITFSLIFIILKLEEMKQIKLSGLLMSLFTIISCSGINQSSVSDEINKKLKNVFKSDLPGVTIIATKNDETVYRKAFGLANVELEVKMEPEMCFKIGSISKQFTASPFPSTPFPMFFSINSRTALPKTIPTSSQIT